MLRNCRYLVKTTLAIYLIFYKLIFFKKFDHISRTYNQINYRNIRFAKVTAIMMTQVLFFNIFFEKDPHLNAVEFPFSFRNLQKRVSFLTIFYHLYFLRISYEHVITSQCGELTKKNATTYLNILS